MHWLLAASIVGSFKMNVGNFSILAPRDAQLLLCHGQPVTGSRARLHEKRGHLCASACDSRPVLLTPVRESRIVLRSSAFATHPHHLICSAFSLFVFVRASLHRSYCTQPTAAAPTCPTKLVFWTRLSVPNFLCECLVYFVADVRTVSHRHCGIPADCPRAGQCHIVKLF